MFQQKMEAFAMVVVTQVAKFVEQNVIAQHKRQTYYIDIQIDIVPGRAAAPVGGIVLYGNTVIHKSIAGGKLGKTHRKLGLGTTAQFLNL
jgi:hypothetical protein